MIKIVTHNGLFHADDVFAVALLKSIMADCEIERTRTPEIIEKADIVIDVGGVYDPSKGRFDHHQKDGVIIDGRSRASFGLVWIEYGRSALRQTYPDKTKGEINEAFNLVQKNLVDPVDAGDTGESVSAFKKIRESGLDVPPMHTISQTIHDFNPAAYSGENFDKKFEEATDFAIRMIKNSMNQSMGIVLSRKHILGAVNNIIEKPTLDASGRPAASRIGGVLILPEYAPWNDVINKNENMDIKRVIWRDETSGNYLCQQTPWAEPFPETWRGKRDQDLDKVMGITDGVFCHNGGFISGFKSLESALIAANTDIKADLNKDMDSIKDRHHEIKEEGKPATTLMEKEKLNLYELLSRGDILEELAFFGGMDDDYINSGQAEDSYEIRVMILLSKMNHFGVSNIGMEVSTSDGIRHIKEIYNKICEENNSIGLGEIIKDTIMKPFIEHHKLGD